MSGADDWNVRRALARLKGPSVAAAFAPFLDDPDANRRLRAAGMLAEHGDRRATPVACALLEAPDPQIQSQASQLLKQLRDPESIPALQARLARGDLRPPILAANLVDALALLGRPRPALRAPAWRPPGRRLLAPLVAPLLELVQRVPSMRRHVTRVVAFIGEHGAVTLSRATGGYGMRPRVALDVLKALGARAAAPLMEEIRHGSIEGRRAAAHAVWLTGDSSCVPALAEAASSDPDAKVRIEALGAIRSLGGVAPGLIAGALSHADPAVRAAACAPLGRRADAGSATCAALARSLDDPHWSVRAAAASALSFGMADCPSVVPRLVAALRDPARRVRKAAKSALAAHGLRRRDAAKA